MGRIATGSLLLGAVALTCALGLAAARELGGAGGALRALLPGPPEVRAASAPAGVLAQSWDSERAAFRAQAAPSRDERRAPAAPSPQAGDAAFDERIAGYVADLRDDDVRYNALNAVAHLRSLGAPAVPALLEALDSDDYQQRQLAALVLRHLRAEPTRRLLAVTVEGLADDSLPYERRPDGMRCTYGASNATSGFQYLLRHGARAWRELEQGIVGPDGQQRFLCASLLATTRCPRSVPLVCDILIQHLRDNQVQGDAMLASTSLRAMGPMARPYLMHGLADADRQARQLIQRVLQHLEEELRGGDPARPGARLPDVSRAWPDPTVVPPGTLSVPHGLSPAAEADARLWWR